MLPGVVWRAEIGRSACEFCDPECEELYWEYWLPRYGELEPAGGT
jgi:hypothetical protein